MRPMLIAGLLLIVLGGAVILNGLNYKTTDKVAQVGDLKVTDTDTHRVPDWVGWVGILGGVVLVAGGARRTR